MEEEIRKWLKTQQPIRHKGKRKRGPNTKVKAGSLNTVL